MVNRALTILALGLTLSQAGQAFEFSACRNSGAATPRRQSSDGVDKELRDRRLEYCRSMAANFSPSAISNFLASDLKATFNCFYAMELEDYIGTYEKKVACFSESMANNKPCQDVRRYFDTYTTTKYREAVRALFRAEPFEDRDFNGLSSFNLSSSLMTETGMIEVERSPQQRLESLLDGFVSGKAGLASLSFDGINVDSVLELIGLDVGILGGYQRVPVIDKALLAEERDQFVKFVGASLVNCAQGPATYNDSSFKNADAAFMVKAQLCEKNFVQPLLQLRQQASANEYFRIISEAPHLPYLNVRELPFTSTTLASAGSRTMVRKAFDQVLANMRKTQYLLLTNQVDYEMESVLLPAMNDFISQGDNRKYCAQAEQILRLRPIAGAATEVRNFVVNQLAYSSCYGSHAVFGAPQVGAVTCPVVIESTKLALAAERSLVLSQSFTIFTDDDDRIFEGIVTSNVLVRADEDFVRAYGRLVDVPKEIILKRITDPLEEKVARDLVKRGYFKIPRKLDGTPDTERAVRDAKRYISALRKISELKLSER
jgi:hypothetical protein